MKFCTNCNSPNLHQDLTQGHLICLTCGTILKESITVESLTFSQNTLTGQLINLTSKNIHTTYNIIQTTLNTICQNMTLPESFAVNAFKWYKLSLRHHLSKGKNILYTLSACLYIVCRQEKSTFMIVDFSTALRIDCVKIGKMYLKLCRFLLIKVNFIDPSFYIHRYSHQLGVKTDIAYRVLKWMKRDWIVTGRRPNNICGAALLLASRIENKKVLDINEVAKVVKASVVVINRRLEEIGDTETANMTVEDFMRVWIEKEEDPPIVKKRMKLEMERLEKLKSMREEEIENMENVICTPVEDDVEMKDISVGVIDKGFLKQEDFNEFEDDSEIDNCLLTEEESMMKEKMWNEMYEDYMKEKESKIVKVKHKISNGQKETEKKQNSKINTTAFDILF